ncbi:MAG: lipid A deacylase LpxR family protein [Leadbetterella sp.]|nr:lipid A deacylase LpxR family protein [Leadbetterella sp.]
MAPATFRLEQLPPPKECEPGEALKLYNRPVSFQTYFNTDLKFVAHDATLQGVLLYPKDSNPNYLRLIHPFQLMFTAGVFLRFGGFSADAGISMRSREYYQHMSDYYDKNTKERIEVKPLGNAFHFWNFIRINVSPNYYYEKNRVRGRYKNYYKKGLS